MATDLKTRVQAARSSTPSRLYPIWSAWRIHAGGNYQFSDGAIQLAIDILSRRQRTYKHMRNSPSMANHCVRASVISFLGYKQGDIEDVDILQRFDGGNFGHLRWQMYLYDMGVLDRAEVPVFAPEMGVAGTCDGVVDIPTGTWWNPALTREQVRYQIEVEKSPHWHGLLEIKEMASYRWRYNKTQGQPEPKVRWQGDIYTVAAQREDPRLEGMCYWFENKDTNNVLEYDLAPEEVAVNNMSSFYGVVMDHVNEGKLPARPYEDGSRECNSCFFRDHCQRMDRKNRVTIGPAKGATMGNFESV